MIAGLERCLRAQVPKIAPTCLIQAKWFMTMMTSVQVNRRGKTNSCLTPTVQHFPGGLEAIVVRVVGVWWYKRAGDG